MAKVILGGLLTSVVLNMFVIPVAYASIDRWRKNAAVERVPLKIR
jgi:Cu/Ag efflux pump CusA